jgi:hypothetical protein
LLAVCLHVISEEQYALYDEEDADDYADKPGKMISRMPKIMQITAKTGLETVMPTFRKPF